MQKEVTITLPFEESAWRLKIRAVDKHIHFDLHWNDKIIPTHEMTITRKEFREIVIDLGFMVEKPNDTRT